MDPIFQMNKKLIFWAPYQMCSKADTVAFTNPPFFGTPCRYNLDSQLCQWISYHPFRLGVGWGGVVGVVEDKAISAQPTELELG